MKSKNLLEQLKALPFFEKDTAMQLARPLGLKGKTVNTYISRYLKHNEMFQLKKGLYVSRDFFQKNKDDISYLFYLANVLRKPSYVSAWTALQYYNLTTEAIYGIISVTLKVTRSYETKGGTFSYHSIQKDRFTDFLLVKGHSESLNKKFDFFIASPSKALFDLLYFRTRQFRQMSTEEIMSLIEELRIDFDDMGKIEQKRFFQMIKHHLHE